MYRLRAGILALVVAVFVQDGFDKMLICREKHRNGPTGKVQLAWMEQYTKFASLARRV